MTEPSESAARYREVRERAGLSTKQLANILGINERSIRRREAGTRPPSVEAWFALDSIVARRMTAEVDKILRRPPTP